MIIMTDDNMPTDHISKVRRVMPNIITDDMVGVSPMVAPIGLIKEMREKYMKAQDKLV
jgi:hypothetical protein